ncbi:MAG: hypothetical protein JNL02_07525 [Saprospiraceae bacterium]|nr:hypothetical protein [Saprospiraceae bacterium]
MTKVLSYATIFLMLCLWYCCNSPSAPTKQPKTASTAQLPEIGGPFENREFFFIGMPDHIDAVDTSAGWTQPGAQKLVISGTIYHRDGRAPAPGVILYYYHTDKKGVYADREGLDRRVVRHGYLRGWVKSDENGRYAIYTSRPAPYPGSEQAAHIHPAIKEPCINQPYYIDEFVFDDDRFLTSAQRKRMENRGGSGILRVSTKGDIQIARHDIVLGLNIPDHPAAHLKNASGLEIGHDQPSFMPFHAYGPDKGSRACPVCKYGRNQGILYFVGNQPDWPDIRKWLLFLDQACLQRNGDLIAYFIYGNDNAYDAAKRRNELEALGKELGLQKIALTYVPSFSDTESEVHRSKVPQDTFNTFVVYRNRRIVDSFTGLKATEQNFQALLRSLERVGSEE